MITPINNYQSNLTFNSKLKLNKTNYNRFNNIKTSFKNFKNEIKNLDEESKDLMFKCIIGYTALIAVITYLVHIFKMFYDKINCLFQ